ncbi:AAA family ATPase [Chitinimonas lacunae]|uniref:AAA family ATPase n=1 Tax=Chitinimonas lacunae TaxID=1963018 RepID=A0ABV8MRD2_9NEIS
MFQLRKLQMLHWDFWRNIEIPLDAQIVTIVGPNGSGKTTLLDALRTLLALRCSGRRDYKRYVRNSTEATAWLRGVVDNPRREGSGLFPYPFFPLTSPRVTLFCRIRRQGGDWTRQYAIADGEVELDPARESQLKWLGVNEYKLALEQAGLTRAIAEVLALEQGDTDKLCEYSPKALLDLVFQVFGDKQVLDNYQEARAEQKEAENELAELERQLDGLGNKVEQMRGRANRYEAWQTLQAETARLECEVLPAIRLADAESQLLTLRESWRGARRAQWAKRRELAGFDGDWRGAADTLDAARAAELACDAAYKRLFESFRAVGDQTRDAEKVLQQRSRLQALAEAEAGADAVEAADRLGLLRAEHGERQARIRLAREERQRLSELQAALQTGRQPAEPFVRQMRAALDEAGIAHKLLTEIVEVRDDSWQAAVEALLAPYRHLVLLDRESDREAAWKIGQQLRYRHFIVTEREAAPVATPGSILEIVSLLADAPGWLVRQLNQVQRAKSVEAGARIDGDWITRDGFYRERRGARHIGVEADDHRFGEAARRARLDEVGRQLRDLNQQILDQEAEAVELGRQIAALQLQLQGQDALQQLAARQDEFAAAEAALPELRREAQQLGRELADAQAALEAARERAVEAKLARQRGEIGRDQVLAQLKEFDAQVEARRHDWQRQIDTIRRLRADLPALDRATLASLKAEWDSEAAVRREWQRQQERLEHGDWETDPAVLELRDKLLRDFDALHGETASRAREVERAHGLTDDARGAYINKLRATIRGYAHNVRRLGEVAGIAVEVEPPHLDNDDAVLAQAGLTVRFDFDQKGMMGLNDGEASGGQQVMKSLILLIGLMMDEANPSGFVFIDEPFAHLDVLNIDKVGAFLKATQAQYLVTMPLTHNINAFAPSELTLCTYKKRPGERWAPLITQTRRRTEVVR